MMPEPGPASTMQGRSSPIALSGDVPTLTRPRCLHAIPGISAARVTGGHARRITGSLSV